jgi:hypothetical protein
MSNQNPYAGKIGNSGLTKVKAPIPAGKGGGKSSTKSGGDLRSGK